MKTKRIKLEDLFQYRSVWMGIAILWVVFYHVRIVWQEPLNTIRKVSYGGVDLFLFASGIGCYYSLSRDGDLLRFLKRRFLRIIPVYWFFLLFWCTVKMLTGGIPVSAIIGNFLCIQTFTYRGNDFNWYISAIWLLYFLAPFFKEAADRMSSWVQCGLMLLVLLLFSIPFGESRALITTMTRIPLFFLGVYFGKLAKNGAVLTKSLFAGAMISLFLGLGLLFYFLEYHADKLWNGLYWYPFLLIIPGMCLLISCICQAVRIRPLQKGLAFLGKYSFEIYLVHVLIFYVLLYWIQTGYVENSRRNWLYAVLLIAPCCIMMNGCMKLLKKGWASVRSLMDEKKQEEQQNRK